jgi:metallo-beta-lactamase family protein
VTIGYGRPILVADGVTLTFIDAGHILGAAQVVLDLHERSTGRRKRLLFSGDVGRGGNPLLRDPEPSDGVDFMIMESTYGGVEHELPSSADDRLCAVLERALETGGKIVIPAFAVERTQQLLFALHRLFVGGCISPVPVFVDSPLAVSATEIYRLHPECFNEDVYQFLFEKTDPFGFESLTLIRSVSASKALNRDSGAAIIISASGMCEAGRVLHHLRNTIEDPRTTILFVGYCAEQTLGWKIRNRWETVRIFGDEFTLKANVEILDSFSGHADHSELLAYYERAAGPKEKVWLVHGEPERSQALRTALAKHHPGSQFSVAKLGQSVEF